MFCIYDSMIIDFHYLKIYLSRSRNTNRKSNVVLIKFRGGNMRKIVFIYILRANFENVFVSFNLSIWGKPNLVLSDECTKHLLVSTNILQDFGK